MALITVKPVETFDLTKIHRGFLLWGRHYTWNEGKAGFVTSATEGQLVVQFHPGIGNVTNHFIIPVSEVTDGQWEIRWSANLSEVWEYEIKTEGGLQEGKTEEGVEGGSDT